MCATVQASTPSLQNDVSYYRRSRNNMIESNIASMGAEDNRNSGIVSAENAHLAGMWLAQPCPMLKSLSALSGECLCAFGAICATQLQRLPREDIEAVRRWLRVWTACVLLYDRNAPAPGAFTKKSPVKVLRRKYI